MLTEGPPHPPGLVCADMSFRALLRRFVLPGLDYYDLDPPSRQLSSCHLHCGTGSGRACVVPILCGTKQMLIVLLSSDGYFCVITGKKLRFYCFYHIFNHNTHLTFADYSKKDLAYRTSHWIMTVASKLNTVNCVCFMYVCK